MLTVECITSMESPVGPLVIRATQRGICAVDFADALLQPSADAPTCLADAVRQLEEYFAGTRHAFTDLPIVQRATDFQQLVWDALEEIPYGATRTYGELAELVSRPGGAQAVGQALTRNPIPIIVPCHRVIPSTGEVGGYAGGAQRKTWLLDHERQLIRS